jgi:hypothetical protein
MEDLLVEKTKKIDAELYDEEGYSIASLEEGIADYKAGRTRSFKSWDDMMKTLQWEIDNDI